MIDTMPLPHRLFGTARKLRPLAADMTTVEADRRLYLTAAAALEARGAWMANALPGECYDPARALHMHQPVNIIV